MRTLPCKQTHSKIVNIHANGTFYLYPEWNDYEKTSHHFIGRKMPNDRVFIAYGNEIEMYEPGEYEIVEVDE